MIECWKERRGLKAHKGSVAAKNLVEKLCENFWEILLGFNLTPLQFSTPLCYDVCRIFPLDRAVKPLLQTVGLIASQWASVWI